jgi:hypothetical protein
MFGGDARHDDGLLEGHLSDPVRGIGPRDTVMGGSNNFNCFGSLAKGSLEFRIDHVFTR